MARGLNLLSEKFTQKKDLKPGLYSDGGGLALQVSSFNTKAWVFRYMIAGRARKMGLGDFELVSLKKAREKRSAAYALVKDGIDPIDERAARLASQAAEKAKALTFGQCAAGYFDSHKSGWKNEKHINQWQMTVLGLNPKGKPAKHDYCKSIRPLNVADIETAHVMKVLEPIWNEKTETANRIRGRIEDVLDRAKALGLRNGENPARWVGHLDQLLPAKSQVAPVEHHPAMPYADLPAFMAQLRAKDSVSARALEFTILTACRTGDTIGATWDELNRREALWTIPKERVKGKKGARRKDHVIPLSKPALVALDAAAGEGQYLFSGGKEDAGLSNAAMSELLKGMGYSPDYATVHGFRSSFRDWVADMTSYPNEMAEIALAHTVADKVEAAYRRGNMVEKRRRMMDDWAKFCAGKVLGGDNVVSIGAVR